MTPRTRAALASLTFAFIILGGFAGLDLCTDSAALATGCVFFGGAVVLATQGLVEAWEEARNFDRLEPKGYGPLAAPRSRTSGVVTGFESRQTG
jgi:arginine exporter protein ArgO